VVFVTERLTRKLKSMGAGEQRGNTKIGYGGGSVSSLGSCHVAVHQPGTTRPRIQLTKCTQVRLLLHGSIAGFLNGNRGEVSLYSSDAGWVEACGASSGGETTSHGSPKKQWGRGSRRRWRPKSGPANKYKSCLHLSRSCLIC